MSDKNEIIKLLKVSPKVVGSKQVSRGIAEGTIGCVIVAEDADRVLKKRLVAAAENAGVRVTYAPSMEWLGRNSGIGRLGYRLHLQGLSRYIRKKSYRRNYAYHQSAD